MKKSFLAPLKIFVPTQTVVNGKIKRDYNLLLLACGAFFSVLATGYVHMGLQLVGTDKFGFQPGESGIMQVSSNCRICQFQLAHCCVVSQPSGQGILPLHLFPSYHRCWSTKCITPTRCAFFSCY